ncbi:MAG: 4Fe-4S binding protein [Fretibacterium sp.]|nr:4Fe-4S binding protein [Fretibacterium sp.]
MKNVTLTINGKTLSVPSGTTVFDAARSLGVEIPALCHHESLPVVSACRLCLVEVEGSRKLQTSCSLLATDGMKVQTETPRLIKYRRAILQLLLDSHPNDCLTCQKAGECLLQKYAYQYGVTFREHDGARRPAQTDLSSPYIVKDDSKCILCGRCVRTCDQVEKERQVLAFAGRGYATRIVADDDKTLETSKCVSCNRCVSLCPVGALLDRRIMGKVRPWEAEVRVKECRSCDYGCHFDVYYKDGKAVAVKARAPEPGRPLCLRGRLMTELLWLERPDTPWRKIGGKFVKASWVKVLGLQRLIDKMELLDAPGDRQ